jgi:hypothetical protein
LFLSGLLCLTLPAILPARQSSSGVNSKPWEKILGTWKQVPGPDDSTVLRVEPEGGAIKFSFGCKQDGPCPGFIVGNYDGKLYKAADNPTWEASFRKTGDRAMQEDGYLNGKLSRTGKWQLSPDGNTLTRTYHSVSPPGSKDITYTHDRSGGPVSKDDPFIGFWKRDWNKSEEIVLTFTDKGDVFTFTNSNGLTGERNCDGKDHPNSNVAGVLYSCSFPDERTYELVFRQNGKAYLTRISKVSEDGKRMVRTDKNADGKPGPQETYEKIMYAAEENQKVTLEGTLVSASCYLADNSAIGNEMNGHKGCGTGCLKQGKPGGLLTKEKHFHILDAPSLLLAPYVGQELRVTGMDYNGVISVKKAEVRKDGEWKEIDIKSLIPGRVAKSS